MSAPIPPGLQLGQQHVVYQRRPQLSELMTPRRFHIPLFYQPHPDISLTVKEKGEEILALDGRPFTIEEVPVERRWAVSSHDRNQDVLVPGDELLDQRDFAAFYQRWRYEFYELKREETGKQEIQFTGHMESEPVPNVKAFVMKQVDPMDESQLHVMHYANQSAPPPAVVYDAKGENPVPRDEALLSAYRTRPASLTAKERAYVEAELLGGDDLQAKLGQLNADMLAGKITFDQMQDRARELVGTVDAAPAPTGKRKGYTVKPCGVEVPSFKSKIHDAECPECSGGGEAA